MPDIHVLLTSPAEQDGVLTQTAYYLISEGAEVYQDALPGIPLGVDAQAYLDAQVGDLWIEAQVNGDSGDLFDLDTFLVRVFKATVLAIRDRDETLVQAINDLADFVGVPPGAQARPSALTIAQIKTAIRNRLPDV